MKSQTAFQKMKTVLSFRPHYLKPIVGVVCGLSDPVCGLNMGQTAENIAKQCGITREQQDEFALASHNKALASRNKLAEEIMAVPVAPKYEMVCEKLTLEAIKKTLACYKNETSFNSVKRHLNALINHAVSMGLKQNPGRTIKHKKTKAKLHKPFDDLSSILSEIKDFNFNLYLCCLLTYGCLLRPHREIRLLTWGNISRDLNFISLSGYQNKSGKRWVIYSGNIEATKISSSWYLWIHHTIDKIPDDKDKKFLWQKEHSENKTGTDESYKPTKIKKNAIKKKYETWK